MSGADERTHFLNADLDLATREDPTPFVRAMEPGAFALHDVAPDDDGVYRMSFELSDDRAGPDALVRALAAIVAALPAEARRIWDGATSRAIDVGVQAEAEPYSFHLALEPETLRAVASIGARLAVTVYAPKR